MKKQTILCIDDVQTNLYLIESVFDDLAPDKYKVLTARSAREGIEILSEEKIDLILLDVMMPEIDGFECAKIIKANKHTKKIPIIFVTANQDDLTIERCYAVGGDDYINKPFNHTELLSRISFHLKAKEQDRLLELEKEYVQSILDLQENMILVTDAKDTITVNKALLHFFSVNTLQEFTLKHKSIADTFLEDDGYFSLELIRENEKWPQEIIERSENEDLLVKIKQNDDDHIFTIKVTEFDEQFVVTLTDVTMISQRSLEYKYEASYDALTEVYNRNMLNRLMGIRMAKVKERYIPLVFMIFDIDHFKDVNDQYGHLAGDEVLKQLANLVKLHTRETDLFARWGGEEFVLALDVTLKKGEQIANNLRKLIEEEVFSVPQNITCSFGITEYKINDTLETITARADHALYEAKNSGRNKVCTA